MRETKCQWEKKGEVIEHESKNMEFGLILGGCYVAAFLMFIPCLMGADSCFAMKVPMMWIVAITYAICNWLAFFHDPTRYSNKYKCLGGYMKCNLFSLIAGIFAYFFDIWAFYALIEMSGNFSAMSRLLMIAPVALLGVAVMVYSYWYTESIDETQSGFSFPMQPEPLGKMFNFIKQEGRISLYAFIAFLGVVVELQGFFNGHFNPQTKTSMIVRIGMMLLSISGLTLDALALKDQIEFDARYYCLPQEFN